MSKASNLGLLQHEDYSNTTETMTINETTMAEEIDVDELIEQRSKASLNVNPADLEAFAPALTPAKQVAPSAPKVEEPNYVTAFKYDDASMPMTAGHHTADPFAPREGKTLVWRDVNMTLVRYLSS